MTCLMHLYEPPALVNGCAHSAKQKCQGEVSGAHEPMP